MHFSCLHDKQFLNFFFTVQLLSSSWSPPPHQFLIPFLLPPVCKRMIPSCQASPLPGASSLSKIRCIFSHWGQIWQEVLCSRLPSVLWSVPYCFCCWETVSAQAACCIWQGKRPSRSREFCWSDWALCSFFYETVCRIFTEFLQMSHRSAAFYNLPVIIGMRQSFT